MQDRRLPNGSKAVNWDDYIKAWTEFFKPIEKTLEVIVTAFDPGIHISDTKASFHDINSKQAFIPDWMMRKLRHCVDKVNTDEVVWKHNCKEYEIKIEEMRSQIFDLKFFLKETKAALKKTKAELKRAKKSGQ